MEKTSTRLSYTQKTDYVFLIGTLLILFLCIFTFKYWYRLGFNLLFLGYFIFKDIRLATVFYAIVVRIILYPSALINKFLEKSFKETEKQYEKIQKLKDIFEKDAQKKSLLKSKKATLFYSWFHLCFLTMNAVTIGAIFFQKSTQKKLTEILYTSFYIPKKFPINTIGYIPLVGNVDI